MVCGPTLVNGKAYILAACCHAYDVVEIQIDRRTCYWSVSEEELLHFVA
jgi:hypothetical protein